MKGKYTISIYNNKVRYELELTRQVTVIKGKSGTGKTTLYLLFEAAILKGKASGVHCNCTDKLIAGNREITSLNDLYKIKNWHNKIIIFDEDSDIVQLKDFASAINNSDNYFIFITRSGRMNWLTYSIHDIYELQSTTDENGKYITRMYNRYNENSRTISPDLIITEDSNSGNDMMKLVFPKHKVVPGYGRDNIYNRLCESKFNTTYIIVDGAAFGSCIGRIIAKFKNKVYIFAPESFEYLLLCSDRLSKYITDEITNTFNFCDTTKFISWEGYFTSLLCELCSTKFHIKYQKGKLISFFSTVEFIEHVRSCIPDKII